MRCNNCGKEIESSNASYCQKCSIKFDNNQINNSLNIAASTSNTLGNVRLTNETSSVINEYNILENVDQKKSLISLNKINKQDKKKGFNKGDLFVYIFIILLWSGIIYAIVKVNTSYYFDDTEIVDKEYEAVSKTGQNVIKTSNGVTSVVHDNQYLKQLVIDDVNDVYGLIKKDSDNQKKKCPSSIVKIEEDIVNTYDIKAVNLCEMDEDFAKEIKNVIGYIYNNFPTTRGYLTNLTLANVEDDATYMAAFMPIFTFITSNTNSGYPIGVKTQIVLNAKYFLDVSKINNSVSYGSKSGYFPPNATRSSTVAHEFGHYLSFVALLNSYKVDSLTYLSAKNVNSLLLVYNDFDVGNFSLRVVQEAYSEYKESYGSDISLDDFRESISKYAMARDSDGEYIYDETIAEAFHDCYLNKEQAKGASKFVLESLKKYL